MPAEVGKLVASSHYRVVLLQYAGHKKQMIYGLEGLKLKAIPLVMSITRNIPISTYCQYVCFQI